MGGAPVAAASSSSATRSSSASRPLSISRHRSSSRATVSAARMFACSRRVCGAVAAAWLAALAAAHTCRGVRVDGAWPRRPHPAALGGARAAWSAGLRSSLVGGVARAGQAAQRSASALGSPDIGTAERRRIYWWGRDSGAPLPGAPNVGSRVPAKPLRFELWGAREFLSLLPIRVLTS